MNMQVTSKMARLGSRLAAVGRRHRELEQRIASVESQPLPDNLVLQRLKRDKLRVKDEINRYEGILRTLTRGVPS